MNKRAAGIISIVIIIICIAYIVFDIATGRSGQKVLTDIAPEITQVETEWNIVREIEISSGDLNSVALSKNDIIISGGESFIAAYDTTSKMIWETVLDQPVYALAAYGDTIYAAGRENIYLFNLSGDLIEEWGPYDEGAILTSISVNRDYVAFADAGNLLIFIVNKQGALKSIIGYPGNQFIIPSAYFDVYLTDSDTLIIANTGKRNIEYRTIGGELVRSFGEEGDGWEFFCGCCNPSHFAVAPDGNIITAEKGINRLKILDPLGRFIEPIAQPAKFMASIPLDLAVSNSGIIYAANRRDSKIYVFKRSNY